MNEVDAAGRIRPHSIFDVGWPAAMFRQLQLTFCKGETGPELDILASRRLETQVDVSPVERHESGPAHVSLTWSHMTRAAIRRASGTIYGDR